MAEYLIQGETLTDIADKLRQYTTKVGNQTHTIKQECLIDQFTQELWNLKEDAVTVTIYEEIDSEGYPGMQGTYDGNTKCGGMFWAAYRENDQGNIVPVLISNEMMENSEENDSGYYYIGLFEIEGVVYDKWRRIEGLEIGSGDPANSNDNYTWDAEFKQYIYTNRIVEVTGAVNEKISPADFAEKIDDVYISGVANGTTDIAASIVDKTISGTYENSNLTQVGSYAFYYCRSLVSATLPNCSRVHNQAFYYCTSLATVNLPQCTSIGAAAFQGCISLTNINLPLCSVIGPSAFQGCSGLKDITLPADTQIMSNAFKLCFNLSTVYMPKCTTIYSSAFQQCSNLYFISTPVCGHVGSYAFQSCSNLLSVDMPKCSTVEASAFNGCKALQQVKLAKSASSVPGLRIYSYAFNNTGLIDLRIYLSSLATLQNVNAFTSTPMTTSSLTGAYGSIYVPQYLVSTYKTASNWSAFADRIVELPETIRFTIIQDLGVLGPMNLTLSAESEMTYEEWCSSPYNTLGCYVQGDVIRIDDSNIVKYVNGQSLSKNNVIQNGDSLTQTYSPI